MANAEQHRRIPVLQGEQADASRHNATDVWLSASAGTGKTQVLTARVLRLLLHGAAPESILCLTFTKAGAAEMANRINEILGRWVRLESAALALDLKSLGEAFGPEEQAKARTLFARVLDARGGGLRIQTIHSFCQSLLGGFPAEAGLVPGFRAIEGREEIALGQSALAHMVANAESGGQLGLVERLKRLSLRLGEDGARTLLDRCARDPEAMEALESRIEARVRRWLDVPDLDPEMLLLAACTDGGFDRQALERLMGMNEDWGTVTGLKRVAAISDWLAMAPPERLQNLSRLTGVWASTSGDIRKFSKSQAPQNTEYEPLATELYNFFNGLLQIRLLANTADDIANALIVGQAYSRTYAAAKQAAGVVDFNDLIRYTVNLLEEDGVGNWIRYKLDQATDHILVDEAQDTNARQWDIVKAVAGEFYAGEGAKGNVVRTLFTVGDYKQAIFGFQGTDPKEFERAKAHFSDLAVGADREVKDLSLAHSYRSGRPILDLVNQLIETVTPTAMGLDRDPVPHVSARLGQSGSVTLWPPIRPDMAEDGEEDAEETWLSDAELRLAADIATKVRDWTQGADRLRLRNEGRDAEPGDVLILVRTRGDLARTIVSRLHEAGVPVAGVDRLTLNVPIAVQDLMSCIRFVLQPEDDLNLASLLVSPLIGWSHADLYERGKQRRGISLWQHLGEHKPPALLDLLGMADFSTPHKFLEAVLSGQMRGRARLIARLGEEARDPIEELLNQALSFEKDVTSSLQLFVDWFDRSEVEIKRESAQSSGAVRVMTVHGAKGLQAPIVILADATRDPDSKKPKVLDWVADERLTLPIFMPRKAERTGSLRASAEATQRKEQEENWRLLYVALTRAEEHLFIGGALKSRQLKDGMGERCWHVQVERALLAMGADVVEGVMRLEYQEDEPVRAKGQSPKEAANPDLPAWASSAAPQEARPPKPLAPSAIIPADTVADPPPSLGMRQAAERGALLHGLFERLPDVDTADRPIFAERWLRDAAGVADPELRTALVADALRVMNEPSFQHVFAKDGLAEAPLAGVVDGQVIAGTVDRLLVGEAEVLVVDFKTGRRVPASASAVPDHHKAQMAAYVEVLRGIFPSHTVRAALLYTTGPALIQLGDSDLSPHKPGYHRLQDNLPAGG